MGQEVILNGRWHDIAPSPSLKVGGAQDRPVVEINGRKIFGVNINGFTYPPADPNCVLYLPGLPGYGSTIWDRSGQGNDGTITGAAWKRTNGGAWVLSYDGSDDFTQMNYSANLDLTTDYSFIFWMRTDTSGNFDGIIGKYKPGGDGAIAIYRSTFSTRLQFHTHDGVGYATHPLFENIYDYVWRQFAIVVDNEVAQWYMNGAANGVTKDMSARTPYSGAGTERLQLGRYAGASFGKCELSMVRGFNSPVSASLIANHYNMERGLFGV